MNSSSSGIRRRIWYVSTTNKGEEEACQLGKGWEYLRLIHSVHDWDKNTDDDMDSNN